MKKYILFALCWLLPIGLVVLGVYLYCRIPTSFLGLCCFTLAGAVSALLLLWLLSWYQLVLAKILSSVFFGLVLLGLLVVAATGVLVAKAAVAEPQPGQSYILVLGAKVNGESPSQILSSRIQAAYDYLMANPDTVAVVSGGQGPDEGISEAECMHRELVKLGIAEERLILENRSTSTWENLQFSMELIHSRGGSDSVGIVTSEFHQYRAGLFAEECGIDARGIPAKTENPLYLVNYFLREIAGVWHYIILGG